MAEDSIQVGLLSIELPDVSEARCHLMHDLTELFGVETNQDALEHFRVAWREAGHKGRLDLDCESDFVFIYAGRDAILEAAALIHTLAGKPLPAAELAAARAQLRAHKRPKPRRWNVGDVFAVPLIDGSLGFGQVLWEQDFAAGSGLRAPTCALFELHASAAPGDLDEVVTSRTIAILHEPSRALDSARWQVLGNRPPANAPFSGPCGQPGKVGAVSGDHLEQLANAYHGLAPWNAYYKDDYLDFYLLPGITRPASAVLVPRT